MLFSFMQHVYTLHVQNVQILNVKEPKWHVYWPPYIEGLHKHGMGI